MLTNKELNTIISTITMLTAIKDYAINIDDNNLYNVTGITVANIQSTIKELQAIKVKTLTIKKSRSDHANAWNKAHPDQHRKHSRDYARRTYKKRI